MWDKYKKKEYNKKHYLTQMIEHEILTDGSFYVYDVHPTGETPTGPDRDKAFKFKIGAAEFYRNMAILPFKEDWFVTDGRGK